MNTRVNVFCKSSSCAQRELRCRWMRFCGLSVGDCRAVAKGPDAREIPNRQHGIDDDGTAFVTLYWKSFEDRVRDCTRCPHECLRGNLFIFLMAALYRACIVSCVGLAALRFARSAHGFQHD